MSRRSSAPLTIYCSYSIGPVHDKRCLHYRATFKPTNDHAETLLPRTVSWLMQRSRVDAYGLALGSRIARPAHRGFAGDDLLGDRSWGQVQGLAGRLRARREGSTAAEEAAVLQGKRASKRRSCTV